MSSIQKSLRAIFRNATYAVPVSFLVTFVWLWLQKKRDKECHMTTNMILRNTLFVGLLVGVALHFGRYERLFEENMDARGADW